MSAVYSAMVIGAGAIGARLDEPGTMIPLTHAGAYRASGFNLVGLVDPDPSARDVAGRWNCAWFADVGNIPEDQCPDVVSVATPTSERASLLYQLLGLRPRAVIAEKPLAPTVSEGEALTKAYCEAGIPLIVNYSRRFTPLWQGLCGGTAMSASIRYGKGLRHNGTHALDLCRMMFGECLEARPLFRKMDHWPDDPTLSAFLSFERCPEVFLQSMDERAFTLFEVDIVAQDWRLIVDSDGRRARRFALRDHVGIPPGKRLVESALEETGATSAMLNLMQNLREVLDGASPLCRGEDAVAAHRIVDRLSA